jgi:hypothetical protein
MNTVSRPTGGRGLRSSRREFLARGGALAGVLTIGGVGPAATQAASPPPAPGATPTGAAPTGAAGAVGLTPARRETYRALAETVVTEPGMRLAPATADVAAAHFAAAYATWTPDAQRRAERVLDSLERSSGRPFAKLDARGRAEHWRACAKPTDDEPVGPERQRLDLAEQAMSLAAVAIGPSGGELDRPMVTV